MKRIVIKQIVAVFTLLVFVFAFVIFPTSAYVGVYDYTPTVELVTEEYTLEEVLFIEENQEEFSVLNFSNGLTRVYGNEAMLEKLPCNVRQHMDVPLQRLEKTLQCSLDITVQFSEKIYSYINVDDFRGVAWVIKLCLLAEDSQPTFTLLLNEHQMSILHEIEIDLESVLPETFAIATCQMDILPGIDLEGLLSD